MFFDICNFENLHTAYLRARKGKRFRYAILEFSAALEENLLSLKHDLEHDSYVHGAYREFVVHDSKKRLIKAAPFRDRVVHHAICAVIESLFERSFIFDSYACRRGKGTHRAVTRLHRFMQSIRKSSTAHRSEQTIYCLQCDISKYFNSVDHEVLLRLIRKKITCLRTMQLIEHIVRSDTTALRRGIPIGNLTSQLFANVYLHALDTFVKRELSIRYYIRYMDDFLILGTNKQELHRIKQILKQFLEQKLCLTLHPKKAIIFPVYVGVNFLGYTVFETHRLLRTSTVKRFTRRIKKLIYQEKCAEVETMNIPNALLAWRVYAEFADSCGLQTKIRERSLALSNAKPAPQAPVVVRSLPTLSR